MDFPPHIFGRFCISGDSLDKINIIVMGGGLSGFTGTYTWAWNWGRCPYLQYWSFKSVKLVVLSSQVSCVLTGPTFGCLCISHRCNHRRSTFWPHRYVHSNQELGKEVLMLGIDHITVSQLLCYCIRSVTDCPQQIFTLHAFLTV